MSDETKERTITIRPAAVTDARFIARGFHMAMLYDDADEARICQFAEHICSREDVLYSWRNTAIAEADGTPVGMVTAYDGRMYHGMRVRTMQLVKELFGTEFPGMEDEAVSGEYYIDSLAVMPEWRGRGIGRMLLLRGMADGTARGLKVTIAVDPVNTRAWQLYRAMGFRSDGTLFIFGHDYEKMCLDAAVAPTHSVAPDGQ